MYLVKKSFENTCGNVKSEDGSIRRFDLSRPLRVDSPSPATLPPPPTNTRPPTSRPAGGVVRGGHLDDGEERLALARRGRRPARRDPLRYVFESSVHAKRMQARPPTSRPAGGVVRGGHLDDAEERLALARRVRRPASRPSADVPERSSTPDSRASSVDRRRGTRSRPRSRPQASRVQP